MLEGVDRILVIGGNENNVRRSLALTVRGVDRRGVAYERTVEGLLAVCLQHEMDHLDGRLFIDRLSWISRLGMRRRLARTRRDLAPERDAGAAAHS